jgi:tetratricopeptide (TPR) repeat protein
VLQFTEFKALPIADKEAAIRNLLENSGGLLYVDNLETVDDPRIITFLDTLPLGVRALVTSRRLTVRVAVYPITVGPMDDNETCAFARSLEAVPRCSYVQDMADEDLIRVAVACDHIPLAIRWVLRKSTSGAEALREADAILATGRRGEELLEFSFRRVFDQMTVSERTLLEVLSLFTQPQPTEVILVGSDLKLPDLQDALSTLLDDVIVQRSFDSSRNDDAYSLLPITRAFVYNEVVQHEGREAAIRDRLSDYFEAKDVKNPDDRVVIRAVRQSAETSDTALVDLARSARRRGDLGSAQDLFNQAISRNPRSWRAYRELAELHRHEFRNIGQAIRNYEQAAANAPKDTFEKARIFREWGILLRDSGQPDAASEAEQKLLTSLELNSRDIVTITALAQLYDRRGASFKVLELCEPWAAEVYGRAKETMLPLLLKAYHQTGNMLKEAEIRDRLRE